MIQRDKLINNFIGLIYILIEREGIIKLFTK